MDVVKGELLVNKVKTTPDLTKATVFSWFHSLLGQMIQYHKCYKNRSYRYLNPYSVVITEENEIYLLDIDASSNHFVLKNLQTPSMREHFLKTTIQPTEENKIRYDIYCFGKTMQYILASLEPVLSLSKMEESRLFHLVEKCFENHPKKSYENFAQVKRDLRCAKIKTGNHSFVSTNKKLKIILIVTLVLIVFNVIFGVALNAIFPSTDNRRVDEESHNSTAVNEVHQNGDGSEGDLAEAKSEFENKGDNDKENVELLQEGVRDVSDDDKMQGAEQQMIDDDGKEGSAGNREEDSLDEILRSLDEDMNQLFEYLHHNDKESNQKIISHGEEMELTILRGLAMAYDREGYYELAISAYGRLIGIENREEHLERVTLRKMKLEEELGLYEQALETGRNFLDINGGNLNIGRLYLEIMIVGERATPQEVRMEYERLKEFIPELENDEIKDRIEV
jgi:tetratricopeptide (TPR) repeat protein